MFVRIALLVGLAVLVWSAVAHSSQAHGPKQVVTVRPYDTLWSIAAAALRRRRARRGLAHRAGKSPAGRRCPRWSDARAAVASELADAAATLVGGMDLDIVFLGTSASAPTARRAPAAILVRRGGERLLFDCAEGTQRQLMRSAIGLPDLEEIFLTPFPRRPLPRAAGDAQDVLSAAARAATDGLRAARPARAVTRASSA